MITRKYQADVYERKAFVGVSQFIVECLSAESLSRELKTFTVGVDSSHLKALLSVQITRDGKHSTKSDRIVMIKRL